MIKNNLEIDVKVKCLEEGVTQAQLAEMVGTSAPYVSRLINKKDGIINRVFVDMLDKLGYDIQLTYIKKEQKGKGEEQMKLVDILSDKSIKKMAARTMIVEGILRGEYEIEEIGAASKVLKDNKVAAILEAIEEISNKKLMNLSEEYLEFAKGYVSSSDNACKREASRIIGNLAGQYPQVVRNAIPALLENTQAEGTVVRWGSAYALSRIIVLEEYRDTDLYERIVSVCEREQENGVKNQYVKALKKIKR